MKVCVIQPRYSMDARDLDARFSELLSRHRASVATRLAATTDMPWSEIAAYVGYETYSGFRRSFRRHKGEE